MAITITSITEAKDLYNSNLDWDGDAAKAANALAAVRWLLINRPNTGSENGRSFGFEALSEEKRRLEAFLDAKGAGAAVACFVSGRARHR